MAFFTRSIDNALYTRRALGEARNVFTKYCVVRATPEANGRVTVTVTVNPEFQRDTRQIILEFWNFFLDITCQQRFEAT
ncbi:MAG TPA: hypothetical protein ENH11_03540 [Candidatus Acetothermia bacterium]|nr:hypothetical protein [Candidatus Acetothermia bacterium]